MALLRRSATMKKKRRHIKFLQEKKGAYGLVINAINLMD